MSITIPESVVDYLTNPIRRRYLRSRETLLNLFTIVDYPKRYGKLYQNTSKLNVGDVLIDDTSYSGMFGMVHIDKSPETLVNYKDKNIVHITLDEEPNLGDHIVLLVEDTNEYINTYTVSDIEPTEHDDFYNVTLTLSKNSYTGYMFVQDEFNIYGIDYPESSNKLIVVGKVGEPILYPNYKMLITNKHIENVKETTVTKFGSYLVNYLCLASIFGDIIPYVNDTITSIGRQLEKPIVTARNEKKITIDQCKQYLDNIYFLGSMGELCVPVFSRKSITTDPNMKKYKKELLEKYKDQLDDPVILSLIEDELIKKDKEWLSGDVSEGFFGDTSKKFDVHRKKQYLTGGATEGFTSGEYDFVENSLSDGWDISSLATIYNEIRRGSYSRGVETQKGGSVSKNLLRVFQNIQINGDDCGTKKYLTVQITSDNSHMYIDRLMFDGRQLVKLTKDNIKPLIGTTIKIRSPLYCVQPGGYCYTCTGDLFKNMSIENIGILSLEVGKVFTTASLKKMHGTKLETFTLDDLNKFTI